MNYPRVKQLCKILAVSIASTATATATAENLIGVSTFATGAAVSATQPDAITLGNDSLWVSYSNGADSTGLGGSSTVVQYKLKDGTLRKVYSIPGSVDGLKFDPRNGLIWAMQNQDANSTLTLINPKTGITANSPIAYAVKSGSRGYDDVAFRVDQVFLSYTNPTGPSDASIRLLKNGSNPLVVKPILLVGATGTNLATGQPNQLTAQSDPDSLALTPDGNLMLSSAADGQVIFVAQPGTNKQSVSFLTVLDPNSGLHVTELDDLAFATAERGSFYLADTNNNRVLKIDVADLTVGSLYASVGSLNALAKVHMDTGRATALVNGNLSGPHGLLFSAQSDDDNENDH